MQTQNINQYLHKNVAVQIQSGWRANCKASPAPKRIAGLSSRVVPALVKVSALLPE